MSSSSSYEIYLCQSDCDLQHQTVPTNAYLVWGNAWYFLIGEKAFFRYHHQSEDPATSFTGLAKPQQGCGPGCGACCLTFLPVGPECRCCGAWCISFELTIHIRRVANRSSQAASFVHACQRAVRDRQDINHELFLLCTCVPGGWQFLGRQFNVHRQDADSLSQSVYQQSSCIGGGSLWMLDPVERNVCNLTWKKISSISSTLRKWWYQDLGGWLCIETSPSLNAVFVVAVYTFLNPDARSFTPRSRNRLE